MKVLILTTLLLLGVVGVACRQQDIRTTTINCSQVRSAPVARLVTIALARTDGVVAESVRVGDGTVTVTYDSMKVAIKNLEFAIAEAGFDAGDIPADRKAREALPADCK